MPNLLQAPHDSDDELRQASIVEESEAIKSEQDGRSQQKDNGSQLTSKEKLSAPGKSFAAPSPAYERSADCASPFQHEASSIEVDPNQNQRQDTDLFHSTMSMRSPS